MANFWGEDFLWPIAPPHPRDPEFDAKIERAFKALYEIIPHNDLAYYHDMELRQSSLLFGMDDKHVWRYWPPTLPSSILLQSDMDTVVTAIILLLRAVDRHIKYGDAHQRMKRISEHWNTMLLTARKQDPEMTLVRERLFNSFIFRWNWIV